jgi:mono/diheme cytochrome c family protein
MGCWRCHGIDGSGNGPSAATLTDEEDRPIRSTDLRRDPFKGGRDPQDVVRTLLTGLNGAPMPSYADAVLFAREDADLTSLDGLLDEPSSDAVRAFVLASPSRAELDALDPAQRTALRDARLAALAHYVLALERRRGLFFRLFVERPEREGRHP